jgi:K+-sensing histidine kinase KdpD
VKRKRPPVPEVASAGSALEEFRAPLAVIIAAAQNLRHYRERLSAEQFDTVLDDITQAAETMSRKVEGALAAAPAREAPGVTARRGRRSAR